MRRRGKDEAEGGDGALSDRGMVARAILYALLYTVLYSSFFFVKGESDSDYTREVIASKVACLDRDFSICCIRVLRLVLDDVVQKSLLQVIFMVVYNRR